MIRLGPDDAPASSPDPELFVRKDFHPETPFSLPEDTARGLGKLAVPDPAGGFPGKPHKGPPPIERMIGPLKVDTTLAERHPGWPKVTLDIHAGTHSTEADFAKLPQILRGDSRQGVRPARVYLPEGNADTLDRNLYEFLKEYGPRLSDFELAELITQRQAQSSPLEVEMRTLARGGVVVDTMDAAGEDFYGQDKKWAELDALLPQATFNDSLEVVRTKTAESAAKALKRDALIMGPTLDEQTGEITAGNFEHTMARIFEKHPELASKEEIRVVATIHAGHSTISHRAKAAGITVSKSLQAPAIQFGPINVLERLHTIGKGPSRELLVKAFAGLAINRFTQALPYNARITGSMLTYYGNTLLKAMDESDVRRLHGSMAEDPQRTGRTINTILAEKGMDPLATTSSQVRRFLEHRARSYQQRLEEARRISREGR
jgi:hypothetical protein